MISQAEHGPDSVCGLITTSKTLFENFVERGSSRETPFPGSRLLETQACHLRSALQKFDKIRQIHRF